MKQDDRRSRSHFGSALWVALGLMQALGACDTSPLRSDEPSASAALQAPRTERAYIRKLQSMVGRSLEDLIKVWGAANMHWVNEVSGTHVYQYLRNDGETVLNGQRIPATCATRFVTYEGIIRAFSYDGNSCLASDNLSRSDYVGPTAQLWAGGRIEDSRTMQWFKIIEVIDAPLIPMVCLANDWRPGAPRNYACRGDEIPARPVMVRIRGERRFYEPDLAMARADTGTLLSSAEGVVDFNAVKDGQYRVTGALTATGFAVWIEDEFSRRPVTRLVTGPR